MGLERWDAFHPSAQYFWQPRLSLAPVKGAARRACLRQVGGLTSFGLCPSFSLYSLASHRALENSCVQPLSRSTFGKCDFGFSPEFAFKRYSLDRLSVRTGAQTRVRRTVSSHV